MRIRARARTGRTGGDTVHVELDNVFGTGGTRDATTPRLFGPDGVEPVAVIHTSIKSRIGSRSSVALAVFNPSPPVAGEVDVDGFVTRHRSCRGHRVRGLLPDVVVGSRALRPPNFELELAIKNVFEKVSLRHFLWQIPIKSLIFRRQSERSRRPISAGPSSNCRRQPPALER